MDYREFLKTARGKKTQKKFAEELGVTREYYGNIERGTQTPSLKFLANAAEKLNADLQINIEIVPRENEQLELKLTEDEETKKIKRQKK